MLLIEKPILNIDNKSFKKHFFIQEICFILGTIIFINLGMDKLLDNYSILKTIEAYKDLILFIAILSSIIAPIINMIYTSIVFELVVVLLKIDINFTNILKISCLANYINLINIILNLFEAMDNTKIIYIITKFNIINYIYLIVISIILLKHLRCSKSYINKQKKSILFIVSSVLWLFSVIIKLYL
ncbi:hypothetical protein [Clostridium lacusfryxellense]|uniref:hypothetical protein n=1 Tax=Clostridium lacusfryxellense TaxID=205328 RepID=UPI001C0B95C8|nr:hypothetical protein [Clostridium lacusfryxellense]MBU3114772.1 hypothetical protein [Clostridium lacusfryxellense]